MLRVLLLLASACAIAGCTGSSNDDAQAAKPAAQAQAAPAQPTMLDPQLKAIQKAKDVQKTVDDAAKATDKAVDDNGG
jgi:glucose/arabinose dehydrogenase